MTRIVDAYPATAYQRCLLGGLGPAVRLTGRLASADVAALDERLTALARAVPALRTRISVAAVPLQLVGSPAPVTAEVMDLSGLGRAEARRALERWRAGTADTVPEQAMRAVVHTLPEDVAELTLDLRDPVLDPPSGAAVLRFLRGGHALPAAHDSTDPMRDALAAAGPAATAAPLPVPPAPALESGWRAAAAAPLPALVAAGCDRLAALTAFLYVLGRLTGSATAGAWVVLDGRAERGADGSALGEYRRLHPVVLDRDARSWGALRDRVDGALRGVHPHLGSAADPSGCPVFAFRADPPEEGTAYRDRLPGACTLSVAAEPGGGFVVAVSRAGGGAEQLLEVYLAALTDLMAAADHAPPRITPPRITPSPRPVDRSGDYVPVHDLVYGHAERTPDSVAIVDGTGTMSYRELRDRAEEIAARLAAAGVGPGAVVGVHLPRSAELVATVLGVLRAGAAFLALDVDYPPARSATAIADAQADALVGATESETFPAFTGTRIVLDGPAPADAARPPAVPRELPAYVLFTSGSTGRPKGVVVTHGGLAGLVRWTATGLGVGPRDRVAQRTPVAFDAGVWELLAPVGCGATLVVIDSAANRESALLADALADHDVTVLQLVPSLLAANVEAGTFTRCPALRTVLCGGEALPTPLAEEFARGCAADLVNVYGPTESTVDATWAVFRPGAAGATVPLGTPLPGVTTHVLDETGDPVVPCVAGELYLGGGQLALGYAGQAARTAERFVPDPFGVPGARLYRTGDRVRLRADGGLEYVDRLDRQVKVRGVRTEPGEVEAALVAYPRVTGAAVLPFRRGDATELAAFFTGTRDVGAVQTFLRERLPAPMVPARLVPLEALPLLPNGKVDRSALPRTDGRVPPYRPPAGPTEEGIAELWAPLLGVDAVGRWDDLTALGRTPATVLRFATALAATTGQAVEPGEVAAAPTVADLARHLDAAPARDLDIAKEPE